MSECSFANGENMTCMSAGFTFRNLSVCDEFCTNVTEEILKTQLERLTKLNCNMSATICQSSLLFLRGSFIVYLRNITVSLFAIVNYVKPFNVRP